MVTAAFLGIALATVAVPLWVQKKEEDKQAAALTAIARAGAALLKASQETGTLPGGEDWESYVRAYGKDLQDPTAKNKEETGWAINRRTGLRLGKSDKKDKEVALRDLPKDTVLLMAGNEQEIYPNRDGSLTIKPGETDPRDRHGSLSPYFLADGTAMLLDKDQAKQLLKLSKIPKSQEVETAQKELTRKIQEEWDKKASGKSVYAGNISLESGEVATPIVPTGGQPAEISLEATSKTPGNITTTLQYLTAEGEEINCDPNGQGTPSATHMDLANNKKSKYLGAVVQKVVQKEDKIGVNPRGGHAELINRANYRKGTKLVEVFKSEEAQTQKTGAEWATLKHRTGKIPPGTQAIRLVISKNTEEGLQTGKGAQETMIRNIKFEINPETKPETPANTPTTIPSAK